MSGDEPRRRRIRMRKPNRHSSTSGKTRRRTRHGKRNLGDHRIQYSCGLLQLIGSRKTKLGEYLFWLARVADAIDYEADERLLRDNLHQNPPLHIRRTLDQSYFLTLDDTGVRDKDQVVYRGTRLGKSFHSHNTRVVMVDQLWLWILDDSMLITIQVSS